jgi:hypothetical protein
MKKQSLKLQEQRGEIMDELKLINANAAKEERNLNEEEITKVQECRKRVESLDKQIDTAKWMEDQEVKAQEARNGKPKVTIPGAPQDKASEQREQSRIRREFSFRSVIDNAIKGKQLTGIEAEMNQEGEKEARSIGKSAVGIALPEMLVGPSHGS